MANANNTTPSVRVRAPRQEQLKKTETIITFNNWRDNLIYTLNIDDEFKPYLKENVTWGKKTSATPHRAFTDDPEGTTNGQTKEQKCAALDLMLGQIANYATVISRNQIIKTSTSLNDIWNKIREHFGFHQTGARFLDLSAIRLEVGERPEDLYQRLLSFFEDNLQFSGSAVSHHGVTPTGDEELSPTVENVTVLLWLEKLHVSLPALIKQRYGSELRNKSLSSMKSEISLALSSLLEEVKSSSDARVCRTFQSSRKFGKPQGGRSSNGNERSSSRSGSGGKYCCLCRTANRPEWDSHYLVNCKFLPEADRRRLSKVRNIDVFDSDEVSEFSQSSANEDSAHSSEDDVPPILHDGEVHDGDNNISASAVTRRVTVRKSPILQCFYKHHPVSVCLDTGSESNFVSERCAIHLELRITRSSQGAVQADGKAHLTVIGEVKEFPLVRGSHTFTCEALVVKEDVGDVVGGEPFLESNDIYVRSSKKEIYIKGTEVITYAKMSS